METGDRKALEYFARRLRELRRAHGGRIGEPTLSQRQFALMLEISPQRYRRYEYGQLEPPLTVLTALRRLTGVCLDRLICGDDTGDDNIISAYGLPPDVDVVLGDRMKWLREQSGVSAARMAQDLRMPLPLYEMWEAGATRPRFEKLHEFSRRLVVPLEFLIAGDCSNLDPDLLKRLSNSDICHHGNPGDPPPALPEHNNTAEYPSGSRKAQAGNDTHIALEYASVSGAAGTNDSVPAAQQFSNERYPSPSRQRRGIAPPRGAASQRL